MAHYSIRSRTEKTLPLSFRVPTGQIEEIDVEVRRDQRKDRVSLLEPIWNWAWQVYKRVGSVRSLIEETAVRGLSKRVDRETQEQLFIALETIFECAPNAVIEQVGRLLTSRAAKYGEHRAGKYGERK